MKLNLLALFILVISAYSCGGYDDDDSSSSTQEEQADGVFAVPFAPLNTSIPDNDISSVTTISISESSVIFEFFISGVPGNTIHAQHIHPGTRCPTEADDTNQDGFIDGVEALAVTDALLMSLDDDLEDADDNSFPASNVDGQYRYNESTEIDSSVILTGKVVDIHGVPESVDLPETVAGLPGETPQQSLPIACGIITAP